MTEFKQQAVRDLAWAISSPPLMLQQTHACIWPQASWFQQIFELSSPLLEKIDADCAELDGLIAAQKDRRMGKYFEMLWFYWLSQNPRYDIVEKNIQIIIDGETLGEIDFILFDKVSKQTIHWELAVKFYLGIGNTAEMASWYGPNLRDRLDIKFKHLCFRQSLISQNPRVSDWLKAQGIIVDQCAVILKGRLYYPWNYHQQSSQPLRPPARCVPQSSAPGHAFSWWLTATQFDAEFDEDQRFMPLLNRGWMERIPTTFDGEILSKKGIIVSVSNNLLCYPLQVQIVKPRGVWDRVFIVSDDWASKVV